MESRKHIRSISRAVAVLKAVSGRGPLNMSDISEQARIPYPTACRIVRTLMDEGLVVCAPDRKYYEVTQAVLELSAGYQDDDHFVASARPLLNALCAEVHWPIALCTRVGRRMMVRASTHAMTSLTFSNYFPGHTLPIEACATGRVFLAHSSDSVRDEVRSSLEYMSEDSVRSCEGFLADELGLQRIRSEGISGVQNVMHTREPGRTSAIAVPVFDGTGRPVAAIGLVYFASAMRERQAIAQFGDRLKETARTLELQVNAQKYPARLKE